MFSTESETITKKKWLIKFFETPTAPAQFHCPKELPSLWCSTSCIFVFLIKEWRYRSCWTLCEASGSGSMRRIVFFSLIVSHSKISNGSFFVVWSQRFPIFVNSLFGIFGEKPLLSLVLCTFHESSKKLATWFWDFCWGKVSGRWIWGPYEWWKDNRS